VTAENKNVMQEEETVEETVETSEETIEKEASENAAVNNEEAVENAAETKETTEETEDASNDKQKKEGFFKKKKDMVFTDPSTGNRAEAFYCNLQSLKSPF
jgi:hypothetical protein